MTYRSVSLSISSLSALGPTSCHVYNADMAWIVFSRNRRLIFAPRTVGVGESYRYVRESHRSCARRIRNSSIDMAQSTIAYSWPS